MTPAQRRAAIRRLGPCRICGGPYAAHRTIDVQIERVAAGEHIDTVAHDHDTTVADMAANWQAYIDCLHHLLARVPA